MSLSRAADHEITAVAEKRLYVGHEHIGFIEEIVCLRKRLKLWGYSELEPERWSCVLHIVQCSINIYASPKI